MLNLRSCLFRLHNHGVCRNLEVWQPGRRIFHRKFPSKTDPKVLALRSKLIYCDYLDYEKVRIGFRKRKRIEVRNNATLKQAQYEKVAYEPVLSVLLENHERAVSPGSDPAVTPPNEREKDDDGVDKSAKKQKPLHMPFAMIDSYESTDQGLDDAEEVAIASSLNEKYKDLYEKYLEIKKSEPNGQTSLKLEDFLEGTAERDRRDEKLVTGEPWTIPSGWMTDYEQFDDSLLETNRYDSNYGTANPNSEVSSVPCGGCGALLHCRDPAIPGYLPSELFSSNDEDLKATICQRCHFLQFYNAALKVNVSIEDYPKLLSVIKSKKAAIVLIIDLTDFPCSIWPDLTSILHPFTPIYLVGNKVDLLPRDCPQFYKNVEQLLLDTVVEVTGVEREKIRHVQLASAKTGYGIEQLINKLQHKWRYKGDVYLVGCTNVGKSSLFNTLLNSDYCKARAVDLVQRATVSAWPGTTLNLLKFPILYPSDKRRFLRTERLAKEQLDKVKQSQYRNYQFKVTRKVEFATLQDNVGRTFTGQSWKDEPFDAFSEISHSSVTRKPVLDESKPEYSLSRWCYDTPGTVQTDQILNLLTTDELLLTLPRRMILPRTFLFKPKQTVFVAGMGRLDYVEGEYHIRCTLFASEELPITICHTADADEVYDRLLESEAFVVPKNDPERLKQWPKLEFKKIKVIGKKGESTADVVLSSIGWIAIKPYEDESVSLKAWTPQGRGIHIRCPALLGKSVYLCGSKIQGTPMHWSGQQVYVKMPN